MSRKWTASGKRGALFIADDINKVTVSNINDAANKPGSRIGMQDDLFEKMMEQYKDGGNGIAVKKQADARNALKMYDDIIVGGTSPQLISYADVFNSWFTTTPPAAPKPTESKPKGAVGRMGEQLKVEHTQDAVRGFRAARLYVNHRTRSMYLSSMNFYDKKLEADQVAECRCSTTPARYNPIGEERSYGPHKVIPDPHGTCGFYAVKDKKDADQSLLMLDVELYGRVIVHDKGYRAEKQRVLQAVLEPCNGFICRNASTGVSAERDDEGDWEVRPYCDDCRPFGAPTYSLSQLADIIGTEVKSEPWSESS